MLIDIQGTQVTLEQLLDLQRSVDEVNEVRRSARRQNRQLLVCRLAAFKWVELHPVACSLWGSRELVL